MSEHLTHSKFYLEFFIIFFFMNQYFTTGGEFTLIRVNPVTLEEEYITTEHNVFTNRGLASLMDVNRNRGINYNGIGSPRAGITGNVTECQLGVIVDEIPDPSYSSFVVPLVSGAIVPPLVDHITWTEATESSPAFATMRSRIEYTGSSRAITAVALYSPNTWSSPPTVGINRPVPMVVEGYAIAKFSTPVPQGATEYIDVIYRCFFIPNQGEGFPRNNEMARAMGKGFFSIPPTTGGSPSAVRLVQTNTYQTSQPFNNLENQNYVSTAFPYHCTTNLTFTVDTSLLSGTSLLWQVGGISPNISTLLGNFLNNVVFGTLREVNQGYITHQLSNPAESPIQKAWGKKSDATSPYFNASTSSLGRGRINVTGSWTDSIPEIYKFNITTSGGIGESTYTISRKNFFGTRGDTWIPRAAALLHLNCTGNLGEKTIIGAYGTQHNHKVEKLDDNGKLVLWDERGISVVDVWDSTYLLTWGADTFTGFSGADLPTTNIGQVAVSNGLIYVSCRDTGLWVVDPTLTNNSVVNLSNLPSYGVDEVNLGGSMVVVAVVTGGLITSNNGWSLVSPTHPLITQYDYSIFKWLEGDKGSNVGRLGACVEISGFRQILWWSLGDAAFISGREFPYYSSGTTPNTHYLFGEPRSLVCSPDGSWWAYVATISNYSEPSEFRENLSVTYASTTYGSNVGVNRGVISGHRERTITANPNSFGNVSQHKYISLPVFLDATTCLVEPSGTCGLATISLSATALNLSESNSGLYQPQPGNSFRYNPARLILFRNKTLCYFSGMLDWLRHNVWEEYGWDGSNWVLGNSNSKPTHSTPEPFLNGLSVSFDDRSELSPYYASDYYTQVVGYGILGNGGNIVDFLIKVQGHGLAWREPIDMLITTPEVTMPAFTEPNFISLVKLSSNSALRLFIDDDEAIILYGTDPVAVNQIGVYVDSATFKFHPDDVAEGDDPEKRLTGYYSYSFEIVTP